MKASTAYIETKTSNEANVSERTTTYYLMVDGEIAGMFDDVIDAIEARDSFNTTTATARIETKTSNEANVSERTTTYYMMVNEELAGVFDDVIDAIEARDSFNSK